MKCPYCNKNNCIPDVAIYNAEAYGGGGYNVCCIKCGGALYVSLSRIVRCNSIYPTTFKRSDWGEKPQKIKEDLNLQHTTDKSLNSEKQD